MNCLAFVSAACVCVAIVIVCKTSTYHDTVNVKLNASVPSSSGTVATTGRKVPCTNIVECPVTKAVLLALTMLIVW